MHFVTGGAFNGKRKWVKEKYPEAKWVSAYNNDSFGFDNYESTIIVLEGIETWVKDLSISRQEWREVVEDWLKWEQADLTRKVIFIGTDITKGIVPIEKEHRQWRDLTGWVYQDIVSVSNQVDVIWYGISKTIKG